MLEIEVRGGLNKNTFSELKNFLEKKAKLKDHYRRISVDLSSGFNERLRTWKDSKFDLRVKLSGNKGKVSLKVGSFHLKKRREIDVLLENGQFLNALELLNKIGFDKGMIYYWESWEFIYKSFEIKISKYTDDYYTWEIEGNKKLDPMLLARKLSLMPYTKDQYIKQINWENQNIHKLYSYKSAAKLFHKSI